MHPISTSDVHNLQRFVDAQEPVYEQARRELAAGHKSTHWMWFIFSQVHGLGHSSTAVFFSIGSLAEARAYLEHPTLGQRLRECAELVNAVEGRSAREIFGSPDDLKFRSSMTLFAAAAPEDAIFQQALVKYFSGEADPMTLDRR